MQGSKNKWAEQDGCHRDGLAQREIPWHAADASQGIYGRSSTLGAQHPLSARLHAWLSYVIPPIGFDGASEEIIVRLLTTMALRDVVW